MKFLLFSSDLMLISAAQGAAARHGAELSIVPNASAALAACSDDAVRLLVVDLRSPQLDVGALMAELRSISTTHIPVLAFGPHVHEASLAAAAAAGCDEVVTRGEFERRLDAALARLVG